MGRQNHREESSPRTLSLTKPSLGHWATGPLKPQFAVPQHCCAGGLLLKKGPKSRYRIQALVPRRMRLAWFPGGSKFQLQTQTANHQSGLGTRRRTFAEGYIKLINSSSRTKCPLQQQRQSTTKPPSNSNSQLSEHSDEFSREGVEEGHFPGGREDMESEEGPVWCEDRQPSSAWSSSWRRSTCSTSQPTPTAAVGCTVPGEHASAGIPYRCTFPTVSGWCSCAAVPNRHPSPGVSTGAPPQAQPTGAPAQPYPAGAGAAGAEPPKKLTLKEKLMAKVGEKASDPALQAKAEKVLKAKAKRTLFKF